MFGAVLDAFGHTIWFLLLIVEDMLPDMPSGAVEGAITAANDIVPLGEILQLLPFAGVLYGYVAWVKVLKFVRGAG